LDQALARKGYVNAYYFEGSQKKGEEKKETTSAGIYTLGKVHQVEKKRMKSSDGEIGRGGTVRLKKTRERKVIRKIKTKLFKNQRQG